MPPDRLIQLTGLTRDVVVIAATLAGAIAGLSGLNAYVRR
jgi:hypothetical protein